MTTPGGAERLSVTDKAALILARGLGYGSSLTCTTHTQPEWTGDPMELERRVQGDVLRYGRLTETLELAGRAIHHKAGKQPRWFKRLPKPEQERLLQWATVNSMKGTGPYRVREFEHWRTEQAWQIIPHTPDASIASWALARLPDAALAVLELYALQRVDRAPRVLWMLEASGVHPVVSCVALVHWLYPSRKARKVTLADAARAAGWRKAEYCRAVGDAVAMLDRWTRRASIDFMRAVNGNRTSRVHGVISRDGLRRHVSTSRAGPRNARFRIL